MVMSTYLTQRTDCPATHVVRWGGENCRSDVP